MTPRRKWCLSLCPVVALVILSGALGARAGLFGGPVFTEIRANATPNASRPRLAAVFVSGDIGFNFGMGPHIARRLADDGIPVIGVNALTYFRQGRSVGEVEALIAAAIRRALALGPAERVVLIGQSYGADMVQVGLTRLLQPLRRKIALVALIVPTDAIHYRISPGEMLGWTAPDADAMATARRLDWVPTICIYGQTEKDSPCPRLTQRNVRAVALPGGHGLHQDSGAVHAELSRAIAHIAERSPAAHHGVGRGHAAIASSSENGEAR